jgi:hypothetical protein
MSGNLGADRAMEEERRNFQRTTLEIPITCAIGKSTFFRTATNLRDDGMMIVASMARKNFLRIFKAVVKIRECPVEVRYTVGGRLFSRRGRIKHYHLDFSGEWSAHRLTSGVWIPMVKMRDKKKL